MTIDEMNKINSKVEDLKINSITSPKFDGSILVITGDLIQAGANIPSGFWGLSGEDTAFMQSCMNVMKTHYVQFIFKNILKVHNREHPLKRQKVLTIDGEPSTQENKGSLYNKVRDVNKYNLATLTNPSLLRKKMISYTEFIKENN